MLIFFEVFFVYEEGGEWVFFVFMVEFFVNEVGEVCVLCVVEIEYVDGCWVLKSGIECEIFVDFVLIVMGFIGLEQDGYIEDMCLQVIECGLFWCDVLYELMVFGVFVVGDVGCGQLFIVWVIVEGCVVVVNVDWFFMGMIVFLELVCFSDVVIGFQFVQVEVGIVV